jgi:hypothetical protein
LNPRFSALAFASIIAGCVLLIHCGKNDSGAAQGGDSTATVGPKVAKSIGGKRRHFGDSARDSVGTEGFYVNYFYWNALRANRSLYGTKYPKGTLYLNVKGENVGLSFGNHEGGWAVLKVLKDTSKFEEPEEGSRSTCFLFRSDDTLYWAWEQWSRRFIPFLRLGKDVKSIDDAYGKILFDGRYACSGNLPCGDSLKVHSDSVMGMKKGELHLWYAKDWIDPNPAMDVMVLRNADTVMYFSYAVGDSGIELFSLLPAAGCSSFSDENCHFADGRKGLKAGDLRRLADAKVQ